jgi:1-aminocyclopropane-1-carboxylate deaminase/D-cysteine desulfhydrase-like pyridoxal-dependent ACC family enzyme
MESQRARGRRPYYFPVGGSVPVGVWAYVRCLEEIRAQAAERGLKVRHVVCACGSGGRWRG